METMGDDKLTNPKRFDETGETIPLEADSEQPTEQEQLDYDLLTVRARKLIFGKAKDAVLQMMGSAERPSQGMGKAAAMVLKMLVDAAKQQGKEIDGGIVINAGTEVVEDLNELAKKNGVFQYDTKEDETRELQDSVLWGVKYYGDGMLKSGEITPELQQQAKIAVQQGIAEEQAMQGTKKKALPAAMDKAMAGQKQGIVGSMSGGY